MVISDIELNKEVFDKLYLKYATKDFIKNDPVQFVHGYADAKDKEIMGFIASLLAFGRREHAIAFIAKLNALFVGAPYEFIYNNTPLADNLSLSYRFLKTRDISLLFYRLHIILRRYGSLRALFMEGFSKDLSIYFAMEHFCSYFNNIKSSQVLLPCPSKGSACKRFNLFLRWMVRDDLVDVGIWKDIPRSKLLIPIDTHVARMSRILSITNRKTVNWKMLDEIMAVFSGFDKDDPAKYDFALFGYGIENK